MVMTVLEKVEALEHSTQIMSSLHQMMRTPEYASLKAEGDKAIAPMLERLADTKSPYALLMMLQDLTGERPVPPGVSDSVYRQINAWRAWGKAAGYIS